MKDIMFPCEQKPLSKEGKENWDKIFGKPKVESSLGCRCGYPNAHWKCEENGSSKRKE
jgi:hypothetical protein